MKRVGTVTIIVMIGACTADAPPPHATDTPDATRAVVLIDTAIAPAIAGEQGWNYQRSASADLTGDGRPERVVLTARVEMYRGQPAWDDGQPWQVYVEDADGARTYVYAQRLQLGSLTMRVTQAERRSATPAILLLEQLPDRISVYEVVYAGPGRATTLPRFQRMLDPRGEAEVGNRESGIGNR